MFIWLMFEQYKHNFTQCVVGECNTFPETNLSIRDRHDFLTFNVCVTSFFCTKNMDLEGCPPEEIVLKPKNKTLRHIKGLYKPMSHYYKMNMGQYKFKIFVFVRCHGLNIMFGVILDHIWSVKIDFLIVVYFITKMYKIQDIYGIMYHVDVMMIKTRTLCVLKHDMS